MTIGDIASLIVALATTGSLIYISRQVSVSRLQAKGQFLLALDAQFEKFNNQKPISVLVRNSYSH